MIVYKKWDIVLLPFPFTNLKSHKKRPAIILSPDIPIFQDVVVLFVTSNLKSPVRYGDYLIVNWEQAQLPKPSMARMKFATIDKTIIIKKLGRLSSSDIQKLQKTVLEYFSL
jgi:mRNA interferase MazF